MSYSEEILRYQTTLIAAYRRSDAAQKRSLPLKAPGMLPSGGPCSEYN